MQQGTIAKKIDDKGFGFIQPDGDGKELFFHHSALQNVQFEDLQPGDKVTYELGEGPKGPNATNINRV